MKHIAKIEIIFCILIILAVAFFAHAQNTDTAKKIHPVKTARINVKEIEKNQAANKSDTVTKRKKLENEVITPGDLPLPKGAKILKHRPPPVKSDSGKFEIKKKEKGSKDAEEPLFPGLGDNNTSTPPDIGGAAGPNHLMVALNTQVRIQDKTGTTLSTVSLDAFFAALGGSPNMFDPKVLYDPFAQRWIITAPANSKSAASALMIGVSATNDPTGVWQLYQFDADAADMTWFDYPSIGFNKNWIVVTGNMFAPFAPPFTFQNEAVYIFDKADLYTLPVAPTVTVLHQPVAEGSSICPAITLDNTQETEYLTSTFSSAAGTLRLYTITGTGPAPVYTATLLFPTSATNWASSPPTSNFAPQSGSASLIANGDRRMQNVVYRGGSLWCAHSIFLPSAAPTRSGVQWWQIDPTTGTVQQNQKIQDGTGTNFFAYPTLAVNAYNDMLIGYSSFSGAQFASCNYSVHLHTDALNTTQPSVQFKAGLASYFKDFGFGVNRWGDYSSTCIDPDDFSLWTIQEYAELPSGGSDRWGTEWNRFVPPVPELYSQDRIEDGGAEPDPSALPMWQSEDIWLRKVQDAPHAFAHMHENAEFRTDPAHPNYVYVEVRNRGGAPSLGTEHLSLYWAKAGSALSWSSSWDGSSYFDSPANTMSMGAAIGTVPIPVIPPGGTAILEFPWMPPNPTVYSLPWLIADQNHFCLLARITTSAAAPFGMTFPETTDLYQNVQKNNNIVWKNIEVYDLNPADAPAFAIVGNLSKSKMKVKFRFDIFGPDGGSAFLGKGKLKVEAMGRLKEILKQNRISGDGIKETGDGTFEVLKEGAVLENIVLEPKDMGAFKIQFISDNGEKPEKGFALTFTQIEDLNGQDHIIGGQTFVFGSVAGFGTSPAGTGAANSFWHWWYWIILLLLLILIIFLIVRKK